MRDQEHEQDAAEEPGSRCLEEVRRGEAGEGRAEDAGRRRAAPPPACARARAAGATLGRERARPRQVLQGADARARRVAAERGRAARGGLELGSSSSSTSTAGAGSRGPPARTRAGSPARVPSTLTSQPSFSAHVPSGKTTSARARARARGRSGEHDRARPRRRAGRGHVARRARPRARAPARAPSARASPSAAAPFALAPFSFTIRKPSPSVADGARRSAPCRRSAAASVLASSHISSSEQPRVHEHVALRAAQRAPPRR